MSTRLTLVLALLLTATAARAQTPAAPPGAIEYYHVDALGSVRAVTDASGAVVRTYHYHPFGEGVGVEAGTDPMRFTGKPRDGETGLDYFGARYYVQRTGRFTTVDPALNAAEALVDPQVWNRYSYVTNNPFRFVDPDGKERAQIAIDQATKQFLSGHISRAEYQTRLAPPELQPVGLALGASLVGGPGAGAGWKAAIGIAMRNPTTALLALRVVGSFAGVSATRVVVPGPTNSNFGKIDYLLGLVPGNQSSAGKGGFFSGVLGFSNESLEPALKSHLLDNLGDANVEGGRVIVTAAMRGANGVTAMVKSVWQLIDGRFSLITARPVKK